MASKSKRRGRVFRASCILAALIIAGSSFAWFTSSDEVTNRLTASSDYGVSIVETFTPPKKWVPGQVINKDVYAVNTGNIDAFVEEEVSGLLTYSYEVLVNTFGAAGVDYEEIKENELKSKAAGGYLIWNNAGATNGPVGTGYTPTASGDYIFRRAIDEDTDNGGKDVSKEKYTLEGYHYDAVKGKYYKIKITGNDEDSNYYEVGDKAYVGMTADGTALATNPNISYYTIHEATAKPVSLTYKPDGNYLEAKYTVGGAGATGTDAYATTAATAQDIVTNSNTIALHDGRKALADLGDAQIAAINAVQAKAKDVKDKADAYIAAYDAVNGTGGSASAAAAAGNQIYTKTDPTEYTFLKDKPEHGATSTETGKVYVISTNDVTSDSTLSSNAQTKVLEALTNYTNAENDLHTKLETLQSAIVALHDTDIRDGNATKASVTTKQETFDAAATAYYNAAVALKNAYANLKDTTVDSGLNQMANDSTSVTTLDNLVASATEMKAGAGSTKYRDALDALIDAYETAAGTNESNAATLDGALQDYKDASDAYNGATGVLTTATTAYGTATSTFDTEKEKSKSTDDLSAQTFDNVVSAYKVADGGTITSAATNSAATRAAAATASTYVATAVDTTYVPQVTGSPDASGTTVADTNYQGSVAQLRTNLSNTDNAYNSAVAYINSLDGTVAGVANASHDIKIRINLADGVKGNQTWSQIPTTNGAEVAHFYLNKVLAAGETSDKLIDSVELDGETTTPATFKDMTFDLNVALKSAQVTYDDNNNILATAADSTFTNAKVNGDATTRVVTITDGKIGWTQTT